MMPDTRKHAHGYVPNSKVHVMTLFWLANFTGGMLSVEDQPCLAGVHSLPIRTAEESKSWPVGVLVCVDWVALFLPGVYSLPIRTV